MTKPSDAARAEYRRLATAFVCLGLVAIVAEVMLGVFLPELPLVYRCARALGVAFALVTIHIGAREVWSRGAWSEGTGYTVVYILTAISVVCSSCVKVILLALAQYGNSRMVHSDIVETSITFLLPYTMSVLVVQSTLGTRFAIIAGLVAAIVFGAYTSHVSLVVGIILSSCVAGALAFRRVRSRSSYIRAGLTIGFAMLPFGCVSLVLEPSPSVVDGVVRIVGCFVGGCMSSLIAVIATPFVEYFGGYASDMRLIEMATLDHPLLKELSVQAPGTWNHSMVIGMMVESAANAIGANPVVCRVGAYFHDIGKTTKPLYFVENQAPDDNRHNKLNPSMSALIIRSHVKDGVELARQHKVPQVIVDMIPQHHGTSVIEYFYEKARKEVEELGGDPDEVDRSLYQYPGPKPQTREAGLLMLADGIEAAARTLSDPSQDRIQGLVQKMLNKVFASGELNECDLTLRDLHEIARCFTRVLTGIYHQRIAYAEPAEKVETGDARAASDEPGSENLKRLGIE